MAFRTRLVTPETVGARFARQTALGPFPAAGARALSGQLVARAVTVTVAFLLAVFAVLAAGAQRFASDACKESMCYYSMRVIVIMTEKENPHTISHETCPTDRSCVQRKMYENRVIATRNYLHRLIAEVALIKS